MTSKLQALFALMCLCAVPWQLGAQEVTLSADRDNTLYEDAMGSVSNGAGEYLFLGNTNGNGVRRALVRFDVSGIPAGSTITGAELTMTMNLTIASAFNVTLHKVSSDWGEGASDAGADGGGGAVSTKGDATWIHTFFDTVQWGTAGGDFDAMASATTSVDGNGAYTWGSTADIVADVQSWLDNGATNFGWILVGDEVSQPTAKRFASRENATGAPQLVVTYTEPSADLAVSVTDFRSYVEPDSSTTYFVDVTNNGPSDVTGATVSAMFPSPLTGCSWTCVASSGSCNAGPVNGDISDTVDVSSGGSLAYTATCTVPAATSGTITVTASVTPPVTPADPNAANNMGTDTTEIETPFFADGFESGDTTGWTSTTP